MNAHVDPAQLAPTTAASTASQDEPLTLWKADLHSLNERVGGIPASIRYDHRDFIDRTAMAHLGSSAFKLMVAITTRTFAFTKVAETVPQDQFSDGLRKSNKDKTLSVDSKGFSIFEGTGLSRNSVKKGLNELSEKGLISSFIVMVPRVGPVTAYMPISWRNLYIASAGYSSSCLPHLLRMACLDQKIHDLLLRQPVHELEARYGEMFPEGMATVRTIEEMYRGDFSRFSEHSVRETMRRRAEARERGVNK